jgi:hypothetical protein
MAPSMHTRIRLQQKARAINLKYASDELRKDRKVVITAMLNHPGCLVYCLDEKLKTELNGLSKSQLQALLETADEDMKPKLKDEAEPLDDIHSCLLCFDAGTMCASCLGAQRSLSKAIAVRDAEITEEQELSQEIEKTSTVEGSTQNKLKKKTKKKKKKAANGTTGVSSEESVTSSDELIAQVLNTHLNINDDINWKLMDNFWPISDHPELTQKLTRSRTINLALDRLGFNCESNRKNKRFLLLGCDLREGSCVGETLDIFSDLFLRFLANCECKVVVELCLFGPNIPRELAGKSFEFQKYRSMEFAHTSQLRVSYLSELFHEMDDDVISKRFDLTVCFNSGFWG